MVEVVTLYRIEHEESGKGPWAQWVRDSDGNWQSVVTMARYAANLARIHCISTHPNPIMEGYTGDDLGSDVYCAVRDLEQLFHWFPLDLIRTMTEYGMRVKELRVRNPQILNRQVVYHEYQVNEKRDVTDEITQMT